MDRRHFLTAAAVLPALGRQTSPRPPAAARHSSFDPWVEVHAANLRANAAAIRKRTGVPLLAVIKNNGYGAGVVNVARALEASADVTGFAVVKLQEAGALRDAGIRKPILLMGPVADADLVDLARRDIALMVYTPIAPALERAAA